MLVLLLQEGFEHMVVTSAIVPFYWTSTSGLSDLQHGQNLKRVDNWVKNTINFGSDVVILHINSETKTFTHDSPIGY